MDLSKLISKADKMSEEIRAQRNAIKNLEEENAKLLEYKEKVKQLKSECDYLARENSKLQQEKNMNGNQITEIEEAHQLELEKLKRSFDEMDELLQQEKTIHKKEEEKLLNTINQLNNKLNETHMNIENKGREERMLMEKVDELKESNKKLKENITSYKKKETNNKSLLAKSKETIKELQLKNRELTEVIESANLEKAKLQALIEHEREKVFFSCIIE
jgi:chromosome segregation ATPase